MPQTWEAGLELFLKHIIRPPIMDHTVATILRLIHLERDGHPINRSAVKGCVSALIPLHVTPDDLTVYKRDIEPRILAESEAFYRAEGERLLHTCNASEFLQKVRVYCAFFGQAREDDAQEDNRSSIGSSQKMSGRCIIFRRRRRLPFSAYWKTISSNHICRLSWT